MSCRRSIFKQRHKGVLHEDECFGISSSQKDSQVVGAHHSDRAHTCAGNWLVGSCGGLQVLGSCAGLPGRQPGSQGRQALQEGQQLCAFLQATRSTLENSSSQTSLCRSA